MANPESKFYIFDLKEEYMDLGSSSSKIVLEVAKEATLDEALAHVVKRNGRFPSLKKEESPDKHGNTLYAEDECHNYCHADSVIQEIEPHEVVVLKKYLEFVIYE